MMINTTIIKKTPYGYGSISKYLESDLEYYTSGNVWSARVCSNEVKELIESFKEENIDRDITFFSSRKRIGYDFVFSVGQTTSLLALIDERVKEGVRNIMQDVANKMLEDIIYRDNSKMDGLIHIFEHNSNRAGEPFLHYHFFISASGLLKNKKLAVNMDRIYSRIYIYDLEVQYRVAAYLQSLGYDVFLDKSGQIETAEWIKKILNKRRDEIERKLKEFGYNSIEEALKVDRDIVYAASKSTRKSKSELQIDFSQYKEVAKQVASELSIKAKRNEIDKDTLKLLINSIVNKTIQKHGLYDKDRIFSIILSHFGKIAKEKNFELIDIRELQEVFQEFVKDKCTIINTIEDRKGQINYLSTNNYLQIEQESLKIAKDISLTQSEIADNDTVEKYIKEFESIQQFKLSQEQRDVLKFISQGRGLTVINGHAGAGKTTIAEVFKNIATATGHKVIGLASTGKAAEELSTSLKVDAYTVDSFLLKDIKIDKKTILYVDEAGMLSTFQLHHLLRAVRDAGARIILVGDRKQLKSVMAGDLFSDIQQTIQEACINIREIRRQKKLSYLEITKAMSEFETEKWINGIISSGNVEEQSIEKLLQNFQKNHLAVAIKNSTVKDINNRIRQKLGLLGRGIVVKNIESISIEDSREIQVGDIFNYNNEFYEVKEKTESGIIAKNVKGEEKLFEYTKLDFEIDSIYRNALIEVSVGDRIITTKNDSKLNVKNGEMFVVLDVEKRNDDVILHLKNDTKKISINLSKYAFINHAFCITTHKSQGMTVSTVHFYVDSKTNYNLSYVALTRGKEDFKIYTNDIVNFLYQSQQPDIKKTSTSIKKKKKINVLSRSEIAKMIAKNKETQTQQTQIANFAKYLDFEDIKHLKKDNTNFDSKADNETNDFDIKLYPKPTF